VKRELSSSQKWNILSVLSTKHPLPVLYDIARVSLSGYYAWQKRVSLGITQEDREKEDMEEIQRLILKFHRKHGYRIITMKLCKGWNNMNHKKVYRLMQKYHLLSVIRRMNPYKLIQKANQEHHTAPNILNREFRTSIPYQKLGTDITYIPYKDQWSYLSMIKDMASGEILSWNISLRLDLCLVHETLEKLESAYIHNELKWAYIQSDQWFHYTHPSFSKLLTKIGCIQSMSRRGNCLDNAPTESFFGHLKDEIDTSECKTFIELAKYIDLYIQYYNNDRPQWTKKKMTPVQYRNHLLEIQKHKQD